jgi:D-glycero-alpha-D-manno-heptose-7-phosphate kinase
VLAEEACHIELNVLKKGIGKQDQYMAAFGGLTTLEIARDGAVQVRPVQLRGDSIATFVANTHMYYTGLLRDAPDVLSDQNRAMKSEASGRKVVEDSLSRIRDLGYRILEAIESEAFDRWGQLLDEHWRLKKRMSSKVSVSRVDQLYADVRSECGVLGGKIVGAGGGGFLMLYCPTNSHKLEDYMLSRGMPRLYYGIEHEGAKVVANLVNTRSVPFPSAVAPTLRTPSVV